AGRSARRPHSRSRRATSGQGPGTTTRASGIPRSQPRRGWYRFAHTGVSHARYFAQQMGFRIEVATDIRGCAATVPIQEEIWSGDVIVPPQLMLAAAHNGGFVALGHADGDDAPAGFVFGFLGIHDYHFRHHSHMLAVREPYRGTTLARELK